MAKRQNKEDNKRIAKERIDILFKQALESEEKADRYVGLARKIAMKYKVRIKPEYKKKYCNYCYTYFNAHNSRVRLRGGKRVVYCKKCKKFNRTLIKK